MIIPLLFLSCVSSLKQIKNDGTVPSVGVLIIITDDNQIEFADSLGKVIRERLDIISQDKKDFILGDKIKENDFQMEIKIGHLELVSDEKQEKNEKVRNKIEKVNDSLQEEDNKKIAGQLIAANVIANVAANAILAPLGKSVAIIIRRDDNAYYQMQNRRIAKTFSFAGVAYYIRIIDKNNKVIWEGENSQGLTISYRMNENEQRRVLIRNISMFIENKVPFFKIKT